MPPSTSTPERTESKTETPQPDTAIAPQVASPQQQALTAASARAPLTMGMAPTTVEEGWRLAQYFAASEIVPKNFKNKPGDILVAMQMGMELGLAPFQALASIAVVNGRATVWGDGMLALLMHSPLYRDHDEYYEVGGAGGVERRDGVTIEDMKKDSTTAVCTFLRANKATPVTRRFSVGQAKKAGLWTKDGPWQNYPDRMLALRARAFAARDAFPDVLRGLTSAEEARDLPPIEEPRLPVVEVRRASATAPPFPQNREVREGDVPSLDARAHAGNGDDARREAAPSPAAGETEQIEATVKGVAQFMGGWTVTLGNGVQVDCTEDADVLEIEKFVGTGHKVRFVVARVAGARQLQSFAIAD